MKYLFCLISIITGFCSFAQRPLPAMQHFRDKYLFIDTNKYFADKPLREISDTINKLIQFAKESSDRELEYELKIFRCVLSSREHLVSPDVIESELKQIAADAQNYQLKFVEADALQILGDLYGNNKDLQSEAIEKYMAAYELYKNFTTDDFPQRQAYTYDLGGKYYRYEDYDNAIKYLQEARKLKRSTKKDIFCSMSNTIGMAYRHKGMYDSAILYFKDAYTNAVALDDKAWKGISQGNIGITYFRQKKYADAIPLLEKDIELSLSTVNIKNAVSSMCFLATIYNDQGAFDKSEKLLKNAISLAENRPFWPEYQLAVQLFTELSRLHGAKGNYRLAYLYADSALRAKDSVLSKTSATALSKAQENQKFILHKLDAEKLDNQMKIGALELGKKRIEITFTLIGIGILLAVIIFIARERKRSELLLLNILPEKIADRLKKKEHPIADYFDHASILFIDMAGFTMFSNSRNPKEVVNMLNHVFTIFDGIAEKYGLEKIKTIGDCYMAVSGLPEPNPHHAETAAKMALEIKKQMKGFTAPDGTSIEFRIGLDCGPVVAGVIGRRKFIYDLWGDTVNTASRMESTGKAGEIHCTDRFKQVLEDKHNFIRRGQIEIKGKGLMETWLMVD